MIILLGGERLAFVRVAPRFGPGIALGVIVTDQLLGLGIGKGADLDFIEGHGHRALKDAGKLDRGSACAGDRLAAKRLDPDMIAAALDSMRNAAHDLADAALLVFGDV
jgi:hypothetical protein